MPKRNRVGYCPTCNQNVLSVRDRCIHCQTKILLKSDESVQTSTHVQAENQKPHNSDINSEINVKASETSKLRYCSYCREPLLNELAKYCAHCGSEV